MFLTKSTTFIIGQVATLLGYLMSGRLNLYLGEKVYHVKSGESFYYQASQKHRIENPGSRPAKFLWISAPPEF